MIVRRRTIAVLLALALAGLGTSAYAACPPTFPPPGYTITPDDDVQAFLMYSEPDRMETLVVQPAVSGTAVEFGMVMPLPNRPTINEAPDDMFDILLEYTTIRYSGSLEESVEVQDDSVKPAGNVVVVERKDVGDFETVVLTADSADALTEWLDGSGFEFKDEDRENFEYYVEKGGYYFVAMRVNMDKANVDDDGMINGKPRPIEFVFESEYPMLPLRIMAHEMDPMRFTLYTLGIFPYYIPGVDVLFIDVIDKPPASEAELLPSGTTTGPHGIIKSVAWSPVLDVQHFPPPSDKEHLGEEFWERYDPLNKWLVRMNVGFDPRGIGENLILERIGTVNGMIPRSGDPIRISGMDVTLERPVIINENLLSPRSGVFAEYSSDWQDFQDVREVVSYKLQTEYGIPPKSIDCKSGMTLMIRPDGHNTACVMESSVLELAGSGNGDRCTRNQTCMMESDVPEFTGRGWQESAFRADELNRLR